MLLASHAAPSARWPGGLSSTRAARRRRQHVAASSSGGADTINGAGDSRRAVVVGGGWAGFAAALALAKAGAQVILLDAADNPGGLSSALTTPSGQLVEPGIKGFWFQYANIQALVAELGIPDPFTPFTRSRFWSPQGLVVESPVFQELPRLPAPLGSFVHTSRLFRALPLADRASAVGLVGPLLQHDLNDDTYRQCDAMSAHELFASCGVTKRLYDEFLSPMLLVTLFAPPTQLSAAASLGALYYFALAHQADFDVRWCKGPIGTLIFQPLVSKLKKMGVSVLGGRRVQQVLPLQDKQPGSSSSSLRPGRVVARTASGQIEVHEADAIVLAAGVPALQQLLSRSPVLAQAPELRGVMGIDCSDVLAVRLWLDQALPLATPSNVVAGFDADVGGTFFALEKLQDQYKGSAGSVLEFDLYNAGSLLPLSDDAIVDRLLHTYLAPALASSGVDAAALRPPTDASVLRFRRAATRFAPGSAELLPPIVSSSLRNVFVAGDCVAQGPGSHGCKGLSQEKAYASGLQAGNRAAACLGLQPAARVLPVEPDEPHVAAAKEAARLPLQLGQLLRGSGSTLRPLGIGASSGSRSSSRWQPQQAASASAAAAAGLQDRSPARQQQTRQLRRQVSEEVAVELGGSGGSGSGGSSASVGAQGRGTS